MTNEAAAAKAEVIKQYQQSASDTGSPEVQVALLTNRIETLSGHFKKHIHDNGSRRGMMRAITQRKRLLEYLRNESVDRYRSLIQSLGLRK